MLQPWAAISQRLRRMKATLSAYEPAPSAYEPAPSAYEPTPSAYEATPSPLSPSAYQANGIFKQSLLVIVGGNQDHLITTRKETHEGRFNGDSGLWRELRGACRGRGFCLFFRWFDSRNKCFGLLRSVAVGCRNRSTGTSREATRARDAFALRLYSKR
jgi:hypothetical protein